MWAILLLNLLYAFLLIRFSARFLRGRGQAVEVLPLPPRVSVIVPFRNEADRLPGLLNALRQQDYPAGQTEWIFVDDHSDDDSLMSLQHCTDNRLRILRPEHGKTGKKQALTAGIVAATGEWILTTDADCLPDPGWIRVLIATAVKEDAVMACGLVQVRRDPGALTAFQGMETAVLQTAGAGSLLLGHPLLNTGASLCFRKDAWQTVNGYQAHQHLASGDDTFLLLQFYQQYHRRVIPVIHPAAVPVTAPVQGFRELLVQRIRWNGKLRHYPFGTIHLTGMLVTGAGAGWLVTVLMAAAGTCSPAWPLLLLAVRLMGERTVLAAWRRVTSESFSGGQMLGMSVFYPVFTLLSFIFRPFMKITWKGRPV